MTASIEIASHQAGRRADSQEIQERGGWGRLVETLTRLAVIGILGLAGQQSISGYQAVQAGTGDILAEHSSLTTPSAPTDLVFAPDGSASGVTVITIADASGVESTITVDAAGKITVN